MCDQIQSMACFHLPPVFPIWTAAGALESSDSETIVGVFEHWRNTRARRSAGNLDLVPPGAASRGSTATVGGPSRISFGRAAVVGRVVPVDPPLVHVVAQIVKPVRVCMRTKNGKLG